MKDFDKELSAYIRLMIESSRITQADICRKVNQYTNWQYTLSPQMLSQLLKGKKRYTYQMACTIMGALDLSIDTINCELWVDECIDRW